MHPWHSPMEYIPTFETPGTDFPPGHDDGVWRRRDCRRWRMVVRECVVTKQLLNICLLESLLERDCAVNCSKVIFFNASFGYGKEKGWVKTRQREYALLGARNPMNHHNARGSTSRYYLLKLPDQIGRRLINFVGFDSFDYATISRSKWDKAMAELCNL